MFHYVQTVFNQDKRVSGSGHFVEKVHQAADVVEVKAVGGFVDDIDVAGGESCFSIGEVDGSAVETVGQFDPLEFSSA